MPKNEADLGTKCGFIAIIGAPNVGKSTLLNRIMGLKVSIVSPKIQTTRTRVLGICIKENTQLVFIDTPGIFQPRCRLDRAMVAAAWLGAGDADHIILLVDVKYGIDTNTKSILKKLKEKGGRADLVLNKVDLADKPSLLGLAVELNEWGMFDNTFMISAERGDGVEDLMPHLTEQMPKGSWVFPEDQISDMPERLLAAELTREKLFLQLHKEVPYAITVETENWEELDDGSIRIEQVIYVLRNSQKAILLGKNGARIKSIGTEARAEMKTAFNCLVHLFLFVKVRGTWIDDPERYRNWGLDFDA